MFYYFALNPHPRTNFYHIHQITVARLCMTEFIRKISRMYNVFCKQKYRRIVFNESVRNNCVLVPYSSNWKGLVFYPVSPFCLFIIFTPIPKRLELTIIMIEQTFFLYLTSLTRCTCQLKGSCEVPRNVHAIVFLVKRNLLC